MVYLACRSEDKANAAIEQWSPQQHRENKLQYVHFDACDSKTTLPRLQRQSTSLSAVLFSTLAELAPTPPENQCQQRLEYHQMNVIGNLQLIEILRDAKKLASGCRIVYSGSEGCSWRPDDDDGQPRYGRHY
jgi:nucleoside-diphosphate-sugar epimerase